MPGTDQELVTVNVDSRIVGKAIAKFTKDLKAALKSGNTLFEAVAVAQAALQDIVPVLGLVPAIQVDINTNLPAELTTSLLTGIDIINAIQS